MTTLKEALTSANSSVVALRPPNFSAPLRSFEAAAEKAVEPFNSLDARLPKGVDYKELVHRAMRGGIVRFNGEEGSIPRELRLLAWALWIHVDGECIAANLPLLTQYLQTIEELKKRSHFRALASSYLLNFAPDGPGIPAVAKTLRKLLEIAPPKWGERHQQWDIFAGPGAVQKVARHFMNAGDSEQAIAEAAKRIGLDKLLAQGGMSEAAFCAALKGYADAPNMGMLRQLTAWQKFADNGGGFRNSDYAEGLLLPWYEKDPDDEEIKTETRNALLGALGDPRMRISRPNWSSVDKSAQAVILRWLVEVALAQFFRVIDKATEQGEGGHMWKRRRRFWLAFFKHGALQEAWVAFSSAGSAYLRGSREDVSYAQIDGAQNNHAVLLMTIGDLTIADWNLNGKCHIWHKGSKGAPVFYKARYSAYALGRGNFSADKSFVHHAGGRWRYEIAAYIQEWTGIDIPPREYS